ncbi:MAG: hypothetical protein PW791_09485 [Neorhizobium sp.]|jgi:hypothetical protein|nr:hypothetical protein [Neorhizobium sp.]
MGIQTIIAGEPTGPTAETRFKVEAAMFKLIDVLTRHGLSREEIALALADAADDYVMMLAGNAAKEDAGGLRQH